MVIFDTLVCLCFFLQDFLPHGTTWFKIHEFCNSLNCFLTITYFALVVNILDESGNKYFSLKYTTMKLAIFILVVFQVLVEFNMPHLPTPLDPKCKYEVMEGGTSN